jgi:2-polyprenyl-6-methoxyphenol hydroxylase-like FAD-dependent oxidoreductase
MVASELGLAGVQTLVLERRGEPALTRAGVIAPRVLEIFDSRGLADRVLARARELHANPEARKGIWAGFPGIDYEKLDSPYPYFLLLSQIEIEKILAEHAADLGVEIRRNTEVTGLRQHADHVEVEVLDASGNKPTLSCLYVVGADGARSTVRRAAGIPFTGREATRTAINVDARLDYPWPESPIKVTNNIDGWGLSYPLKGGVTRFGLIDAVGCRDAKEAAVDLEAAKGTIRRLFGSDFGISEVVSTARFHNAMYMAERLRERRVVLVGESVRVHYPASGVGMNFCLQDAFNLGWKLAATVQRRAPEWLLDSYESERRPEIEELLDDVRRQTALQFEYSEDLLALKRFIERELIPLEPVNHLLRSNLAGLRARYAGPEEHPLVGRRLREMAIGNTTVHRLLRKQKFLLLDLGAGSIPPLEPAMRERVECASGRAAPLVDLAELAALLVRPDGHVAWVGDRPLADGLPHAQLHRWLG